PGSGQVQGADVLAIIRGSQPRDSQVQASSRETISDQLCPPSICPHLLPVQVLPIAVVVHCLRDLPPGRPGHPPALTSRTHSLSASCRWQQEAHARESCHQADQVIHLLSPHSSASCRWQQEAHARVPLHNGDIVEPDDYNPISAIPNGDWTYQTQVSLLVAPVAGYTYTCSVQHVSLQEPLLEDGSEWRGAEPADAHTLLGCLTKRSGCVGAMAWDPKGPSVPWGASGMALLAD
uniref:Immunoglobulin C1-set domain-containing protein n=1 Tax=Anas platyrhynchos platyrhynchos TaxID=8840 RepID=A0A493TB17_ANAPP